MVGDGLGLCNCSNSVLFWVVVNCSQSVTNWGFFLQNGRWSRGRTTPWTHHLCSFFSCFLFGDSKKNFHLHRSCLKKKAQEGLLRHRKVKQLWMQGQASMQWVVEKATTLGSAEQCSGKGLATFNMNKYSYCWVCDFKPCDFFRNKNFLKANKNSLSPFSVSSLEHLSATWAHLPAAARQIHPSAANGSCLLLLFHGPNYCVLWSPVGLSA